MPETMMELISAPATARSFATTMRPTIADCTATGRLRLDSIARWLQDVAYDDVENLGLEQLAVWVVRRSRVQVNRFPRFAERSTVRTFCSGLGRMWAERRTTITSAGDAAAADVEAVSLWVHLHPETWRPTPFSHEELAAYGDGLPQRRISARLRHSAAPGRPRPQQTAWTFRATDCDIAGHVNNAAYWQPIEEHFAASGLEPGALDAEFEFRTPAQPGAKRVLHRDERWWITGGDGEVHGSAVVFSRGG
ncbi:MAG: acyl-ACP thioesterase domain-containing protein [Solirubrobacteraceae bacterium]